MTSPAITSSPFFNPAATPKYHICLQILVGMPSATALLQHGIPFLPPLKIVSLYTLCPKKSDAKIQITITTAYLIRIKYLLSGFNYHLSGANFANFNKIHRIVSEHQLINKWYSRTEISNMEKSP